MIRIDTLALSALIDRVGVGVMTIGGGLAPGPAAGGRETAPRQSSGEAIAERAQGLAAEGVWRSGPRFFFAEILLP